MRTIWAALLMAGLAGTAARAETDEQKGKKVIDDAVAALGGPAFLNMQTRVEAGRIYGFYLEKISGMGVTTLYTEYLPKPAQPDPNFLGEKVRDARGKKQDDVVLYGTGLGYEITFRGARPLSDIVVNQFRIATMHNIFYILRQRLNEPGMIFERRESAFVDNRPVDVVDITDANNERVTVYFDQQTKLPARQTYNSRDPVDNSRREEVTIYDKYREVSGVMWPFTTRRERNGDKIFEMYSESVEINRELSDSTFVLPPNMKILKKDKQ